MREFRINKYLKLRLEGDNTVIYVNDKKFQQCKFLLLNIPIDEITSFDEIESVDEAAEKLDKSLGRIEQEDINIPPEVEFWGHCSNLQMWVENDYDTRLLHSNLAFPLLKKLTEAGDLVAKRVFKEEIVKRLESGHVNVMTYLTAEKYLDFLNENEWSTINKNVIWKYLEDSINKLIAQIKKHEYNMEEINENILDSIKFLIEKDKSIIEKIFIKNILQLTEDQKTQLFTILFIQHIFKFTSLEEIYPFIKNLDFEKISKEIAIVLENTAESSKYLDKESFFNLKRYGIKLLIYLLKRDLQIEWDSWFGEIVNELSIKYNKPTKHLIFSFFFNQDATEIRYQYWLCMKYLLKILDEDEILKLIEDSNSKFLKTILSLDEKNRYYCLIELKKLISKPSKKLNDVFRENRIIN